MALHKVQIMARNTSTTNEDYIDLTDHKLAVDIGTTPDTAAGDLAAINSASASIDGTLGGMATDLGTVQTDLATVKADIALMKADLALVNCKTYKGSERTTTTGAAEELTIPSGSKRVIISCAPSSEAYIEINGDASTSSPLYLEDPFGPLILDLGGVTKLSAYVVAGNLGAVFFG